MKNYEISNLIRLGIVKEVINTYGYLDDTKINITKYDSEYIPDYVELNGLSINIDDDVRELELTELGELFISACQEKRKK